MKVYSTVLGLFTVGGMLVFSHRAWGQAVPSQLTSSLATAQKQYKDAFPVDPQLYNGPEYLDYAKRYKVQTGHQFFLTSDKQNGSVYYNDHYFTGLQLLYDVVYDQIVLQHATSPLSLKLVNENVRDFTIAGHRFVRLVTDSTASPLIRTGFYEVLVDSTIQLIAKRAKQIEEKVEQNNVNAIFTPIDKLFIRKAGVYYAVSKKRPLLRLFADHSKEVQKYIQDNKLKFKKARREDTIIRLTRYYAGLVPQ